MTDTYPFVIVPKEETDKARKTASRTGAFRVRRVFSDSLINSRSRIISSVWNMAEAHLAPKHTIRKIVKKMVQTIPAREVSNFLRDLADEVDAK
jgi:hypothetical protein